MSEDSKSLVKDADGHVVGQDTTRYHSDGSSTTTHADARITELGVTMVGRTTGVTENSSDGTSKNSTK